MILHWVDFDKVYIGYFRDVNLASLKMLIQMVIRQKRFNRSILEFMLNSTKRRRFIGNTPNFKLLSNIGVKLKRKWTF